LYIFLQYLSKCDCEICTRKNRKLNKFRIFAQQYQHYVGTKSNITLFVGKQTKHLSKVSFDKTGCFGSYARNEQTSASDLDLLVEFEDNTPNLSGVKDVLRKEMQSVFRVPVDICREKYIKPIFRQQILNDAVYV